MSRIYNFSAGPATLPEEVLSIAKKDLKNWNKMGASVMEISHRSKEFICMTEEVENNLRILLNIPMSYKILFVQGGARGQFSAIPLNLLKNYNIADYICSGYWSNSAVIESKKYCNSNILNVRTIENGKKSIIPMSHWCLNDKIDYIHYCPNETIEGIAIHEEPKFDNKIVVGDFSSFILSQPININNYSLIYAGAQKNIGPSGITIVILHEKLLNISNRILPSFLNYQILNKYKSMFNTPPTFSWYLAGLVFKWLIDKGGINEIYKINRLKAKLLYEAIDNSNLYFNNINIKNRSIMNVTFNLSKIKLEKLFFKEALKNGLYALKGHSIIGGIRASIYNAMPLDGVKKLIKFMLSFEKKYF
ncbi:Phosphoserine aminotransferase [Buchnera aphidicola (Neophyllaphis podocarpi)]|uniref:3-phosphoserine/phosphohydroxythreonine transaminase n=1 Tax=Buchnera aphidicola TaxID=9 RepID=UPI003464B72C